MQNAAYSNTPLAKKLGLNAGTVAHVMNAPENYLALLQPLPIEVSIIPGFPGQPVSFVHIFVTKEKALKSLVVSIVDTLLPTGIFWISWPKKTSGITTDVTEHTLRRVCLPCGLVDVKVCAIDDTWSALKFVWRKGKTSQLPPHKLVG